MMHIVFLLLVFSLNHSQTICTHTHTQMQQQQNRHAIQFGQSSTGVLELREVKDVHFVPGIRRTCQRQLLHQAPWIMPKRDGEK